jgi:hypothetical protein
MKKNCLLVFAFLTLQGYVKTAEQQGAWQETVKNGVSSVGSWVGTTCLNSLKKIGRNKATYAFFGAHVAAVGAVALAPIDGETKGGVALAGLIGHYLLLGRHFKNSYFQGLRFDDETDSFEQLKILNTSNWLEKNGIIIDGVVYTRGFQLWQGYQKASNKQHFLRHFLSVIMVDSSANKTRQVIVVALEALKQRLADCSNPGHERYTNAGLLVGKYFYCHHVHPGKPFPHNTPTWIWQEERGGDLFKVPFGEAYFEEWLNKGFLTSLGVYETDMFARVFSLSEGQNRIAGFTIPWYRISSWSRNAATRYYVALLKQYVFLLACRALCDDIVASEIVNQKQDLYW